MKLSKVVDILQTALCLLGDNDVVFETKNGIIYEITNESNISDTRLIGIVVDIEEVNNANR